MPRRKFPKTYNSIVNPFINQTFEASTGHITKKDDEKLDRDSKDTAHNPSLIVYRYEYGYFVYTHLDYDKKAADELYSSLKESGFSKEFIHLLRLAKKNKCKFLQLDCDGVQYEDLTIFDW